MANFVRPQLDDRRMDELPNEHDFDDVQSPHDPIFTGTEETQARYVHPQAKRMFRACPCTRKIPLFGRASEGYGPACTVSLGVMNMVCKGVADQTLRGVTYAMLVDRFGISIERYQRLAPIPAMGSSIKAFTAALCDTFACFGYTKRWYMFASCVIGGTFALAYGLLPQKESSANIAAAFIFLSCFCIANVDILSQGHYARLIRVRPEQGPALVSFVWWFVMLGTLVSCVLYGPLSDSGKQRDCPFISAAMQYATAFIYPFNFYGEKTNRELRAADAAMMYEEIMEQRQQQQQQQQKGSAKATAGALKTPTKALKHVTSSTGFVDAVHEEDSPNASGSRGAAHHLSTYSSEDEDANDGVTPDGAATASRRKHHGNQLVNFDGEEDEMSEEAYVERSRPTACLGGVFEFNKEVAKRNWKVFVYSGVMTCAVIAMTCGSILADTLGILIICVVCSVICCGTSFWALPLIIAKANVFGYLQEATYLYIAAADGFFMGTEECLPTGPHFSFTFYYTISNIIGGVASLIGVFAFNYIFSKHSYRLAFISTTIIRIISGVFDIVIVKRWNIDVGMPDRAMYICGDAIISQLVYMLNSTPMVILLSRLCPRGSESVVYALMAGFQSLGTSTGSYIASVLLEWDWPVNTAVTPCTGFEDNLPWLMFVGHICTPLIVIPLTLLVPACRICDDIDPLQYHAAPPSSDTEPTSPIKPPPPSSDPPSPTDLHSQKKQIVVAVPSRSGMAGDD